MVFVESKTYTEFSVCTIFLNKENYSGNLVPCYKVGTRKTLVNGVLGISTYINGLISYYKWLTGAVLPQL